MIFDISKDQQVVTCTIELCWAWICIVLEGILYIVNYLLRGDPALVTSSHKYIRS